MLANILCAVWRPDLFKHVKQENKNSNPFCRVLKGTCDFVGAWHGRE
jgi:hypothetical protein